jgi:DNA primase
VSLSIIDIPSGKDPDELIKQDPEIWKAVIQQPQYALDWLTERYKKLLDISTAQGKRQFSDVLLPVVRGLADPVEEDHYLLAIADAIGVSKEALTSKLRQTVAADPGPRKRKKTEAPKLDKKAIEDQKAQDHLLSIALLQPQARSYLALLTPAMLYSDEARTLLAFLIKHPDFTDKPEEATPLKPIRDYVKIIVLQYEELYQGLELTELRYEAARLQTRLVERFVKNQKQTVVANLSDASEAATQSLLEEVKQLDLLLKQVKGSEYAEGQEAENR